MKNQECIEQNLTYKSILPLHSETFIPLLYQCTALAYDKRYVVWLARYPQKIDTFEDAITR